MAKRTLKKGNSSDREETRRNDAQDGIQIDLSTKTLWISTPCHDGRVDTGYARALHQTAEILRHFGVRVEWGNLDNDSDIVRGRMGCFADFMVSGFTHCLMIDSDIRWDAGDVLRMMMHEVDFICGIYMKHNDQPKPVVCFTEDFPDLYEEALVDVDGKQLARRVEIRNAGTGFMMFSRNVGEKLIEAHPELKSEFMMFRGSKLSEEEQQRSDCLQEYYYNVFFPMMQDRGDTYPHHVTEDYAFCERWRDLGGKIWADPDVALEHIGNKVYRGRLADFIKTEMAE